MKSVRPGVSRLGSSTARRGKPVRNRNDGRGKPWRLLRAGADLRTVAGPGSPQAAARSLANAELFRPRRSRTPNAAC